MKNIRLLYSVFVVAALSLCSGTYVANAQTSENNTNKSASCQNISTSSIYGARYEILRDSFDGTPCYRIDKYTGEVWRFTFSLRAYTGYYVCEREASDCDTVLPETINYQLLVETYSRAVLMNINTGEVWLFQENWGDKVPKFILMKQR